jgi:hypothetical protein
MDTLIIVAITVVAVAVIVLYWARRRAKVASSLGDARSQARRWVERLGGQVYTLDPKDDAAARQALADAAERFTAAGAQIDQSTTQEQYRLAGLTAHEGLYYIRAARVSLGLDPGPELPALPGQEQAGAVSEDRSVVVEGLEYSVSPTPSDRTRHYYPGGTVAGRPVQRGWYSDPWWQSAIDTGAWALSSYLIASSLFYGTAGYAWDTGYTVGLQAADGDDGCHDADHANAAAGDTVSPGDFDGGDY